MLLNALSAIYHDRDTCTLCMYRSDYENEGTVKIRNEGKVADENWKSWDPPTVRVLNFLKIF